MWRPASSAYNPHIMAIAQSRNHLRFRLRKQSRLNVSLFATQTGASLTSLADSLFLLPSATKIEEKRSFCLQTVRLTDNLPHHPPLTCRGRFPSGKFYVALQCVVKPRVASRLVGYKAHIMAINLRKTHAVGRGGPWSSRLARLQTARYGYRFT